MQPLGIVGFAAARLIDCDTKRGRLLSYRMRGGDGWGAPGHQQGFIVAYLCLKSRLDALHQTSFEAGNHPLGIRLGDHRERAGLLPPTKSAAGLGEDGETATWALDIPCP